MASSSTDLRTIFGTNEPPVAETRLDAGKMTVRIADGQVASVSWGGREILRGVTYFLRDADWATPLGETTLKVERQGESELSAKIAGTINAGGIRFDYTMEIEGDATGHLRISTRGTAGSTFRSNRVGLTVLHPLDCAGEALRVIHSDGSTETGEFPFLISPSQPVFDIAGLAFPLNDREQVAIDFRSTTPDGGTQVFEMEDQRNWGDASYKTYVGSLLDPWPFEVADGDVFEQHIEIRVTPAPVAAASVSAPADPAGAGDTGFRMPAIGVSVPHGRAAEALTNVRALGMFRPAYISAYLRSDAMDPAELAAIGALVETLECPLTLELEVDGEITRALPHAAAEISRAGLAPEAVLACPEPYLHSYQPNGDWPDVMPLDAFYGKVRDSFPSARIGGGMLTYFTELNRKWPPASGIDYVGHSYCPIVHSADDRTVVQNIDTLAFIAKTVAAGLPEMPYEIVSAQLSMRQNPYGAAPQPNPGNKRIAMAEADPRENGQFAGLWMLDIARVLAGTHASRACFGALSGPAAVFSADHKDGKRPSYYALEALCRLAGADEDTFLAERKKLLDGPFALAAVAFEELRG